MELNKILENLCYYDKRNPDCTMDEEDIEERKQRKPKCSCDNCYYGRTELAEEIIQLKEILNETI